MATAPLVTVCMPTYNSARYIRAALASVLTQTLQDFEIVVCDDASTDETPDVVQGMGDDRVRYVSHAQRLGIPANRNRCLAAARGEHIAWLDADDVYLPEMLEVQTRMLACHSNVGLVHGAFHVISEDGNRLPDWPLPFASDTIERGQEAFRELILLNYIAAPTVVVRRECHERAGPYAVTLGRSGTDWDMWLRIALHADLAYTATPVATYRQHPASISAQTARNGEALLSDISVVRHVLSGWQKLIPDADVAGRRASAALTARALRSTAEAMVMADTSAAAEHAALAMELAGEQISGTEGVDLLRAIETGDEYSCHRQVKALLRRLYRALAGTRFGSRLAKVATSDPAWDRMLAAVAEIIERVVPPAALIAVVDKWDPTILHLSQRQGWHFPDRRLLPNGYPPDDAAAIAHLKAIQEQGAEYFVIPEAAFWWLDHYQELRAHLESRHDLAWRNDRCVIYRLLHYGHGGVAA